jgi:DNA-binding transcriptional ArsR family regulator
LVRKLVTDTDDKRHELDLVLGALAHEARRQILLLVWCHGGSIGAGGIAARFAHSWPTTSRHLAVLEQAGLLQVEKQGRNRLYRLSQARLQVVSDWLRWFHQATANESAELDAPFEPRAVLRSIAMAYPEAVEEASPTEAVIQVRNRPFLLLRTFLDGWAVSAKLPHSQEKALKLPFVDKVRYRLGKNDWVSATFGNDVEPPLELLWDWIDESYRSQAPERLLAEIPAPTGGSRLRQK